MPAWASPNIGKGRSTRRPSFADHSGPRQRSLSMDPTAIASREKTEKERAQFLDYLTRKHAERLGIPLTLARERVEAVAVTARKVDEPVYGA
jgi:hypothetical protein